MQAIKKNLPERRNKDNRKQEINSCWCLIVVRLNYSTTPEDGGCAFHRDFFEFVPNYTKSNHKIILFITVLTGAPFSSYSESMVKINSEKYRSHGPNAFNDHYQWNAFACISNREWGSLLEISLPVTALLFRIPTRKFRASFMSFNYASCCAD